MVMIVEVVVIVMINMIKLIIKVNVMILMNSMTIILEMKEKYGNSRKKLMTTIKKMR